MESQDVETSQDRKVHNGIISADCPDYGSDVTASCDTYSLQSASPSRMSGVDMGVSTDDAGKIDPWREALISRNMDFVKCCMQAILGDLLASERPYFGLLMTTVLKEVEDITVEKVEPIAQSIFNQLAPLTTAQSSEKTKLQTSDLKIEDLKKNSTQVVKTAKKSQRPQITRPKTKRKPVATKKFSSFVCPGCERFVRNKSFCAACYSVVLRVDREVERGIPFPKCSHHDFKGAPSCRGCRYNKYNKLWRFNKRFTNALAQRTGIRDNGEEVCQGCHTPLKEGEARCRACYALVRNILKARSKGTPVPQCRHDNFSGCPVCRSCRFTRFLEQRGIGPFKCGSCFELYSTPKCQPCNNFGISLEKAYGKDAIPQCFHKNREGAPKCLNCRYHLWKEGKMLAVDETPEKPEERNSNIEPEKWIKPDPDMDVKPDIKRVKMETVSPWEFEMA